MDKECWSLLVDVLGLDLALRYVRRYAGSVQSFRATESMTSGHIKWLVARVGEECVRRLCAEIGGEVYIGQRQIRTLTYRAIRQAHQRGMSYEEIARKVRRPPYTIRQIQAIIHAQKK